MRLLLTGAAWFRDYRDRDGRIKQTKATELQTSPKTRSD